MKVKLWIHNRINALSVCHTSCYLFHCQNWILTLSPGLFCWPLALLALLWVGRRRDDSVGAEDCCDFPATLSPSHVHCLPHRWHRHGNDLWTENWSLDFWQNLCAVAWMRWASHLTWGSSPLHAAHAASALRVVSPCFCVPTLPFLSPVVGFADTVTRWTPCWSLSPWCTSGEKKKKKEIPYFFCSIRLLVLLLY